MAISLRAKNFMAALASNFGVQALRFLTLTLLARRLGTNLFGAYNYVLLLLNYGFLVVEFGLRNLGIREFAHGKGSFSLIRQILKIRLGLAFAGIAAVVFLTHSAFPHSNYFWPSFFLGASLFMDALLLDYVLVAEEALVPQAVGNLGQAAFLFSACYWFVKNENDFLPLSQFYFASHFVWIFIVALTALPFLKKSQTSEAGVWHTALKGAPFMIATLVAGVLASMDLLLLGQFHYDSWLGNYSAGLKIIGIALGIINSLLASVQPRLAKESEDLHSKETASLIDSTTRFLWMFVAPTVIGCWLFGNQLVAWVFGAGYEGAGPLLKPLSLAFAFLTLAMAPLHLLYVSHHTRDLLKIVLINLFVSFLLVGGVLVLGHPELVAWAMVIVEACFMISAWKWYGTWGFISLADLSFFMIPVVCLTIPLLLPLGPALRFTGSAVGYLFALLILNVWKQPWFTRVLGRS